MLLINMHLNVLGIIFATIAQFVIGAVWYSLLFGKLWGKIHGFDKLPKETQQKMMKEMGPFYFVQLVVTIVTSVILAVIILNLTTLSPFAIAFLCWLGFIIPAQVSSVIFGGTEPKWIVKKIAVQSGAAFFCIEAAAMILSIFH